MVNHLRTKIFKKMMAVLFLLCQGLDKVDAITPQELRRISGQANQAQHIRAQRMKANDYGSVLNGLNGQGGVKISSIKTSIKNSSTVLSKSQKQNETTLTVNATSSNHTIKTKTGNEKKVIKPLSQKALVVKSVTHLYVPPARTAVNSVMASDAVTRTPMAYGIRLGQWMPAELNRNTSSAEPGLVELTLMHDVVGDVRTLFAGTLFFAQAKFNTGTERLDLKVKKAITPDGKEFKIEGIVFDQQKIAGLSGHIPTPSTQESLNNGIAKGSLAVGGELLNIATGNGVLGTFINETSEEILDDKRDQLKQTPQQKVIFVSPQTLSIRVEASF